MLSRRILVLTLATALLGAGFGAPALHAADATVFAVEKQGFHHDLCSRIFQSLKKVLERVAARLTRADSVDLAITSMAMDERHRIFIDMEGMVELRFKKMSDRVVAKLKDAVGQQMSTNGPVALDFKVTVADQTAADQFHVEFQAGLVIVLDEFLSKMVRFGCEVAGTVTMMGVGNDFVAFLDGIDSEVLAASLEHGLQNLTKVVMSLAGVEAYDAYRELRPNRQGDGTGGSVTGAVLAHLALALVKGCTGVATSVAGMSLGAVVGTALAPGVGTTIGGIIGAASFHLIGNVVYRKLALDVPMAYRLLRIKRLTAKRAVTDSSDTERIEDLSRKIEKFEIKILKRVSLDMRVDRFGFLEEFMQQIRRYPLRDREAFLPLFKKLKEKLRFEVVERQDRLAQRMLDQLTAAFESEPK